MTYGRVISGIGGNMRKPAKECNPSRLKIKNPITPEMRFHARKVNESFFPIFNSVANTAANRGLPMIPLYADERAATSNPSAVSLDILSFSRIHADISIMRNAKGPSGPTLAPEKSEKKEDRRVPGNVL